MYQAITLTTKTKIMKTLKKLVLVILAICLYGLFSEDTNKGPYHDNQQEATATIQNNLEEIALDVANYPSTVESGLFQYDETFGDTAIVSLTFSASNAFGVRSDIVVYAEVEFNKDFTIKSFKQLV